MKTSKNPSTEASAKNVSYGRMKPYSAPRMNRNPMSQCSHFQVSTTLAAMNSLIAAYTNSAPIRNPTVATDVRGSVSYRSTMTAMIIHAMPVMRNTHHGKSIIEPAPLRVSICSMESPSSSVTTARPSCGIVPQKRASVQHPTGNRGRAGPPRRCARAARRASWRHAAHAG